MPEVSKRWPVPRYLLFPLIVASLLFVAAKLVALERAELIARLADEVAHGDAQSAMAAVRQLAAMPRPPFGELIEAAASPNVEISTEAQAAINHCLRRLQRSIAAGRNPRSTAKQLTVLAESLATFGHSFDENDDAWLRKTARKIVRLANRLPSRGTETPLVASHCTTILEVLGPAEVAVTTFADAETHAAVMPAVTEVSASPGPAVIGEGDHLARDGIDRLAARSDRTFPTAAGVTPMITESGATVPDASVRVAEDASSTEPRSMRPIEHHTDAWRPEWTHPMFFGVPAMPIEAIPLPRNDAAETSNPVRPQPADLAKAASGNAPEKGAPEPASLMSVPSRELLARWAGAKPAEVAALEQELTVRGFNRLSEPLVAQLFSDDAQDRLDLVNDVLTRPGTDARPWLLLLAADASADVRLVVVTIMATSNDAELIEKAWQVATHDDDPRIAALVTRLRERRARIESY